MRIPCLLFSLVAISASPAGAADIQTAAESMRLAANVAIASRPNLTERGRAEEGLTAMIDAAVVYHLDLSYADFESIRARLNQAWGLTDVAPTLSKADYEYRLRLETSARASVDRAVPVPACTVDFDSNLATEHGKWPSAPDKPEPDPGPLDRASRAIGHSPVPTRVHLDLTLDNDDRHLLELVAATPTGARLLKQTLLAHPLEAAGSIRLLDLRTPGRELYGLGPEAEAALSGSTFLINRAVPSGVSAQLLGFLLSVERENREYATGIQTLKDKQESFARLYADGKSTTAALRQAYLDFRGTRDPILNLIAMRADADRAQINRELRERFPCFAGYDSALARRGSSQGPQALPPNVLQAMHDIDPRFLISLPISRALGPEILTLAPQVRRANSPEQ